VCVAKATGGKKTTPKKKPANPCAKNNGGCAKARKCMNVKGKAMCGKCPKGYTNSGTKQCKKAAATKKPTKKKFFLAGNGKASCASGKIDENACKAAAKALKTKFIASSAIYARYPHGCFVLNKKFYYNKGKTGKANKAASPVCCSGCAATKKTTPKKKPAKLVLAGNGKATCGSKGAPVKNEAGCKAAAKVTKGTFVGSSVKYNKYPRGCFLVGKKFYYNKGKTGQANKAASPVCVSGGAATKPSKKLVLAGNGKATCGGKGGPVQNESGCKAAAKAMKKPFISSGAYAAYPKGCFVYNNKFYYNKGKTGKAHSKASPICVIPTKK